jgi:hypothetical protein
VPAPSNQARDHDVAEVRPARDAREHDRLHGDAAIGETVERRRGGGRRIDEADAVSPSTTSCAPIRPAKKRRPLNAACVNAPLVRLRTN